MIFTPFSNNRFPTHEVRVGNITIGGDSDIVIQTMCNTPTGEVEAGYKQSKEVISAGTQMVRFAVRNRADAESIGKIKELLLKDNINTPLVADVHFSSQAAFVAAKLVDKVRINPGNFIDKRATFDTKSYTELEWKEELNKIELTLNELIDICVAHDTALRIGVNHGSLSDRIMSKYGNTTEGMVESAMEFLRICKKRGFQNVIISLKSSNIRIMNSAYFMLAKQMQTEDMHYPLHLGVTEAGNDLSGRVRSAVGIGRLLGHGIGDTIRISLTENPVKEIPAAQKLAKHFKHRKPLTDTNNNWEEYNPLDFSFYKSHEVGNIGGEKPAIAVCDIRNYRVLDNVMLEKLGYMFNGKKWIATSQAADAVYVKDIEIITELPENLSIIYEAGTTKMPCENATPLFNNLEFIYIADKSKELTKWVSLTSSDLSKPAIIEQLRNSPKTVIVLETVSQNGYADQMSAFLKLKSAQITNPVIVKRNYVSDDWETFVIESSADSGSLLVGGMGNGVWLTNPFLTDMEDNRRLTFEILQASRVRISQTEYIACPSCGRTQFDIESVLAEVRSKTNHLTHLKIAVMGCIVNGPGEMADADYGYVGAAPNRVALYKGKVAVKKNISADIAVEQLIELIKENNDWVEP